MTAPLTGYADRISVRAGEKIAFKVSSAGPGPYHAMLVRIIRGDPNPGGLPTKLEDQSEVIVQFRDTPPDLSLYGLACRTSLLFRQNTRLFPELVCRENRRPGSNYREE